MRQTLIASLLSEVAESSPAVNLQELEHRFTAILSSYHVERTGTELAVVDPFPRAAREYISSGMIEGLSRITLKSYRNLLARFFLDIKLPLAEIDAVAIKMWLYRLQQRGLSDVTVASYQRILSAFFSWSVNNDFLMKNPCSKVASIKYEKKHKKALTPEELASVRDACVTLKERVIVEMLYSTGCRVREFVAIRRADINLVSKTVLAHNWKSRREKVVYLSDVCLHYLRRYLEETSGEYVFYHSGFGGQKPVDIRTVERIIERIGARAGLPKGRLHPHIFRHTLATNIVSNGGSLSDAQAVLDHAKPETTLIYAEISKAQVQEVHRRCVA